MVLTTRMSTRKVFTRFYIPGTTLIAALGYKRGRESSSREEIEMKTTKSKVFTTLALALVAALALSAGGGEKMTKLKAELNLTDAQVNQLEQRFTELQPIADRAKAIKEDLKALENAASPDQRAISAKKAELGTAKKEHKEKSTAIFRTVLNREQWAKYEAMQAEYHKSAQSKKY